MVMVHFIFVIFHSMVIGAGLSVAYTYAGAREHAMQVTLLPLLGLIVGAAVVWSNLP